MFLCPLLCCNSAADVKSRRTALAQKSSSAPIFTPSYYFTLRRRRLAERLKRLANLLVTCPRETTIRAKKWHRVGAPVGFHLIIPMNEAKLRRFCHRRTLAWQASRRLLAIDRSFTLNIKLYMYVIIYIYIYIYEATTPKCVRLSEKGL